VRGLTRPMSKRDLYESIINFRTTIDTTLDDNMMRPYDDNEDPEM
jgi:hypothetical protein